MCTSVSHVPTREVHALAAFWLKNQLLRAKVENTIHDSGINKKKPMWKDKITPELLPYIFLILRARKSFNNFVKNVKV
jgi:cytochrome b subunit of formate dehydrogenase